MYILYLKIRKFSITLFRKFFPIRPDAFVGNEPGDYPNLMSAIDAKKKRIFVRETNLTLHNGQKQ